MTEYTVSLLIANVYRILCLFTGLGFAYLGYRLFEKGITERGGQFNVDSGNKHLVLRQVGPGVFFALFGVFVVVTGGLRTVRVTRGEIPLSPAATQEVMAEPTPSVRVVPTKTRRVRQVHKDSTPKPSDVKAAPGVLPRMQTECAPLDLRDLATGAAWVPSSGGEVESTH
jgi:hypothetical protein